MDHHVECYSYSSPIGALEIVASGDVIHSISFSDVAESQGALPEGLKECVRQLDEYFSGATAQFTLKLEPKGTAFQLRVWSELQRIGYGSTISYQELAERLGDPNLVRAVGGANGRNPIAIIIPCHRVIGATGKLVGYGGGLYRKKWLLAHELAHKREDGMLF